MIVAFESASTDQSVALATPDGEPIGDASWSAVRSQGSELLPRLEGLLAAHERRLEEVSGIAVGIGPGSFTGLRVGLALAKGLAAGLGRPLVGIGSLEAWLDAMPDAQAALVRAGAAEVWALARGSSQPELIAFDALPPAAREAAVVAARDLAADLGLPRAAPPDGAAAAVARLAIPRFAAGSTDDLAALEPIYLRPPRGLGNSTPPPVTWL